MKYILCEQEGEKMGQMVDFTMEREGLVKPGDRVELKEDRASTMSGMMYYYTIKDAIAMSSNLKRPLTKLAGTVRRLSLIHISQEILPGFCSII